MSTALPPFLASLELPEGQPIDERALRRAYARQLKRIDIEAEPQHFQALRETLDNALRWLAMRDRMAQAGTPPTVDVEASPSTASAPVTPLPAAPPAAPAAETAGNAVYALFHQRVTAVLRNPVDAREALDDALHDERLASIDARTFFEWRVARLLADGWHPGHDQLFDPAIDAFGWEGDHARLAHFAQVGALLGAAIRERALFHDLAPEQKVVLNRLLVRVRDATAPEPARLREEVPQLQYLVQRVPHWLRIVAPVDPVNARFEMWRHSPASMMAQPVALPRTPRATGKEVLVIAGAILALVLVGLVNRQSPSLTASNGMPPMTAAAADADLRDRQRRAEAMLSNLLVANRASPRSSPVPVVQSPARAARRDIP